MIFKALNDPARRDILDSLRKKDGQSLTELEPQLDMTRFGVMKHLGVLEEAGLITTKKVGRFKYHYLNTVPLQEVLDRWIEPLLAKPLARGLLDLKNHMEGTTPKLDSNIKPDFIYQTIINCSQDALWDALTIADQIASYHFVCDDAQGDAEIGAKTKILRQDGSTMLTQTTLKLDPKTRIETTFEPNFIEGLNEHSRVVFLIDVEGPNCKLTCEHYDIPTDQDGVKEGWARQVASLKSWLETGKPIKIVMGG